MTTVAQVLSQFQATGVQTCFHDRHINPQIYADLNGGNWSIKDYEGAVVMRHCARSSAGWRGRPDAGSGDCHGQGIRPARSWRRGFSTGLKWSFMPRQFPGQKHLVQLR